MKYRYYSCFTDKETSLKRLTSLPKAAHLGHGKIRIHV